MTDSELLSMLKSNLEIAGSSRDGYLGQLLAAARAEAAAEGADLDPSDIRDANILVMYASYLYRGRAGGTDRADYRTASAGASGMPRMLRYALNNRIIGGKGDGRA